MSRIDACYAHLVFSPCAVGALLKQDSIGAAGIPWWLRRSCHPTQLASQQCTQMPQTNVERPFSPICVHSYCVFPCGRARRPRLAGLGATPPQPGGGLLERICPVGPFSIVPRRLAGGCVPRLPGGDVTEKRSLQPPSQQSALFHKTQLQTASFRSVTIAECAFP